VATRAPDYALEGESGDRERYLVLAHQAGDPFAFTEIVKDHYSSMFGHALRRLGDRRAAEDAVQDALLRAYKGLDGFSGEYKLQAWLHRIVDNVCADIGSRRQRDARLADHYGLYAETASPPADEDLRDDHAVQTVRAAVAALPDTYREALVLRDVMDMEYADVAEQIGITEQNARARVSRARAALRKLVAPSLPVWVLIARSWRRGTAGTTRIAAKLTGQLSSAAGQATATASQMTAAAATAPPDVVSAPVRFAPAIGTLAVTAVAAVASVGIPAFVNSSHPAPSASKPVPHVIQVSSGPAVTGHATTVVGSSFLVAADVASSTTSTSTPSTTAAATPALSSAGGGTPAAAPVALQPGYPLPTSYWNASGMTFSPQNPVEQLQGTVRIAWGSSSANTHLDAFFHAPNNACQSYIGGTLKWLVQPATQGDVSFEGWITQVITLGHEVDYRLVGSMTATGEHGFTGSGWFSGTLFTSGGNASLEATGWGPGSGSAPNGPGACAPALVQTAVPPSTTTSTTSSTTSTTSTTTPTTISAG